MNRIKNFTDVMFFDNGREVSLRVKKLRTTKEIQQITDAVKDMQEILDRNKYRAYNYYLGNMFTQRDINNYRAWITELKGLRQSLDK